MFVHFLIVVEMSENVVAQTYLIREHATGREKIYVYGIEDCSKTRQGPKIDLLEPSAF